MDFKDSQRIYGVKFPQSTADDIVRYCLRRTGINCCSRYCTSDKRMRINKAGHGFLVRAPFVLVGSKFLFLIEV